MPTYEYACKDCGEQLEAVQSFKDDALTTCPHCQGELRKVFSAAGIIFKGSGWHIKDYKDADKKPAAKTTEGDGASPKDKTTDTKAASNGKTAKDTPSKNGSKDATSPSSSSSGGSSAPS